MGTANWPALYVEARRTGGVTTSGIAARVGIARNSFRRRVRRESWREPFPDCWLVPGAPLTSTARYWAAVLSTGSGSVLSHATASHLLGLHDEVRPRQVHVLRRYGLSAIDHPGLVRHRSRSLLDRDFTEVDGLPITTAARTIMDLAAAREVWRLEAMMLAARQRGLLDLDQLVDQYERRPGLHGAPAFRAASILLTQDGADSILERRARRILSDAGLHPSPAPHPVDCDGRTLHADIAFPDRLVAIECDGFAYHGPDAPQAFEGDRTRWGLLQDAGWQLVWLTWKRLHGHPAAFVAEVRRKLAA